MRYGRWFLPRGRPWRHLGVQLTAGAAICQLREAAQAPPPVLPGLVVGDTLEYLDRLEPHVGLLVQEPQRDVEEARVRLGRDAEEEADVVVGMDVLGQGQVYVPALRRRQLLYAQPVVHVVYVEALQGSDGIKLRQVLMNPRRISQMKKKEKRGKRDGRNWVTLPV